MVGAAQSSVLDFIIIAAKGLAKTTVALTRNAALSNEMVCASQYPVPSRNFRIHSCTLEATRHWVWGTRVLKSAKSQVYSQGLLQHSLQMSASHIHTGPPQTPLIQWFEQHLIELSSLSLSPEVSGQGDLVQCGHITPLPQAGSVEDHVVAQTSFLSLWEDF